MQNYEQPRRTSQNFDLPRATTQVNWIYFLLLQGAGLQSRYRLRFFEQVGHETMFGSGGNKHLLNIVTFRLCKIMNNLLEHLKILMFKVIFQY